MQLNLSKTAKLQPKFSKSQLSGIFFLSLHSFLSFWEDKRKKSRFRTETCSLLYAGNGEKDFTTLLLHDSCHPSVTPDGHEKGCKRPVHRRSGTPAPLKPIF
jgi:hypothetical protein